MVLSGLINDPLAASRLVSFCAFSDSMDLSYSIALLINHLNPNTFSWNAVIRGYADRNRPKESILLYKRMLQSNARPDNYTFPFLFKACWKLSGSGIGSEVFGHVVSLGFDADVFVVNAAMHMFVACGGLEDASKMFDKIPVRDLVSWNTMINGYVQRGYPENALQLFREMEIGGPRPDHVTMIGLISCCAQLKFLELGRKFHHFCQENGLELTIPLINVLMDMYVKCGDLETARVLFDSMPKRTAISWTTMVVGYAKLGLLDDARRVFDEMPEKDVIPWNALITGCLHSKKYKEALNLFHDMQESDVEPDEVTMVSLLSACSQLGALEMGFWLHHYIEKHNLQLNIALGTALVDMYAKCGNIEKSVRIFQELHQKNERTWTAIICGLANHGHAESAIDHFMQMAEIGLAPDEVTFLGVLSACCHAGLVDKGRKFFAEMSSVYNLSPKVKHYSCMVDLFGRAGLLPEAHNLINSMPMEPDAGIWGALFFACKIHGHIRLGEYAALKLLELDPDDSGIYVLLANMYIESNMRDEAVKVRCWMRKLGIEKSPGCSMIEINGSVNEFIVRDESHPQCKEIYACLMQLTRQVVDNRIHEDSQMEYICLTEQTRYDSFEE